MPVSEAYDVTTSFIRHTQYQDSVEMDHDFQKPLCDASYGVTRVDDVDFDADPTESTEIS